MSRFHFGNNDLWDSLGRLYLRPKSLQWHFQECFLIPCLGLFQVLYKLDFLDRSHIILFRHPLQYHLQIQKDKDSKRSKFPKHHITIIRVTFPITNIYNIVNLSIAFSFQALACDVSISKRKLSLVPNQRLLWRKKKKGPYNVLVRNKAIINIIWLKRKKKRSFK